MFQDNPLLLERAITYLANDDPLDNLEQWAMLLEDAQKDSIREQVEYEVIAGGTDYKAWQATVARAIEDRSQRIARRLLQAQP